MVQNYCSEVETIRTCIKFKHDFCHISPFNIKQRGYLLHSMTSTDESINTTVRQFFDFGLRILYRALHHYPQKTKGVFSWNT